MILSLPMTILAIAIIIKYLGFIKHSNLISLNLTELIDKVALDEKYETNTLYHKDACNYEVIVVNIGETTYTTVRNIVMFY
jgi:hypothetical protein